MVLWLSHRTMGWYILGSHLGTCSNTEQVFKGPVGWCTVTTPSSHALTSNKLTKTTNSVSITACLNIRWILSTEINTRFVLYDRFCVYKFCVVYFVLYDTIDRFCVLLCFVFISFVLFILFCMIGFVFISFVLSILFCMIGFVLYDTFCVYKFCVVYFVLYDRFCVV